MNWPKLWTVQYRYIHIIWYVYIYICNVLYCLIYTSADTHYIFCMYIHIQCQSSLTSWFGADWDFVVYSNPRSHVALLLIFSVQELAVPSFDAATARAMEMALGRREEVPFSEKSERFEIWNPPGKMSKTTPYAFHLSLLIVQTLGNCL